MGDSMLPPVLWLVALQFGLYAAGWAVNSLLLGEDRLAIAHWGAYLLQTATGMVLLLLRDEPRTWLPYNGSNITFVTGIVALRRGVEMFARARQCDAEHAAVLALIVITMLVLGPGPEHAPWRTVITFSAVAYVIFRNVFTLRDTILKEFGRMAYIAAAVPAMVLGCIAAWRAAQQVASYDTPLEMHTSAQFTFGATVAFLIAAAIFNFCFMVLVTRRLSMRLRQLADHDGLTGLLNRRAFDTVLAREWQRARRHRSSLGVVVLDIDHFKWVNDRYGHPAGDQVLTSVAKVLMKNSRAIDAVGRLGGEEFAMLMPDSDPHGLQAAAERLRQAVQAEVVDTTGGRVQVTISLGVAHVAAGAVAGVAADADAGGAPGAARGASSGAAPGVDAVAATSAGPAGAASVTSDLLARADAALYRSKASGRNRVTVAA
jgi:diguanylate cyclase (GGDEF)-like protein